MNAKYLIRQVIVLCLVTVFISAQSMIAFAGTEKTVGNLSIVSLASGNEKSIVKVNGEQAATGRSIFSSSVIETSDNSGAIISAGKLGKIELAANSKIVVTFDDSSINGNLIAGSVSVLDSTKGVTINVNGKTIKLEAGESAAVGNLPASSSAQTKSGGGLGWLPWTVVIIGGAVAAIIYGASTGESDIQTPVSPTR